MAAYLSSNKLAGTQQVITTTPGKTIISLTAATGAATLKRGWIKGLVIGADGSLPATDCAITYEAIRVTTLGTGTSATPSPVDGADTAAGLVCTVNMTVEPSFGVSLLPIVLNQRNSQYWQPADDKHALIIPATNLAGVGIRAYSSNYVSTVVVTVAHDE